jgi:hypothetical protein
MTATPFHSPMEQAKDASGVCSKHPPQRRLNTPAGKRSCLLSKTGQEIPRDQDQVSKYDLSHHESPNRGGHRA